MSTEPDPAAPLRLVAVGDSLTEGIGDPAPGCAGLRGELDGWARHLTADLNRAGRPTHLVNLARRSATVAVVLAEQLERAQAARPDVVLCIIGVNDMLHAGDPDTLAADYEQLVAALAGTGALVVTATLHDVVGGVPLLSDAVRRAVRDRTAAFNRTVRAASDRHGTALLALDDLVRETGTSPYGVDRLHPGRTGHRALAHVAGRLLARHGYTPEPGSPPHAGSAAADGVRHLLWIGVHAAPGYLRGRVGQVVSRTGSDRTPRWMKLGR